MYFGLPCEVVSGVGVCGKIPGKLKGPGLSFTYVFTKIPDSIEQELNSYSIDSKLRTFRIIRIHQTLVHFAIGKVNRAV